MQEFIDIDELVSDLISKLNGVLLDEGSAKEMGSKNMLMLGMGYFPESTPQVRDTLFKIINDVTCSYKKINNALVPYVWNDAQSGFLCFSAIKKDMPLPFGCKINIKASVNDIIDDVFAEIASLFSKGVLDVFVSSVPKNR
jgi:hypothetical protein